MTNTELIEKLKENKIAIDRLSKKMFSYLIQTESRDDIANTTTVIDAGKIALRLIASKLKSINEDAARGENTIEFAELCLAKKNNKKAVKVLINLVRSGDMDASLKLGKVFMYGVYDKLGNKEFVDREKAAKCFYAAFKSNRCEAGYYLGLLYKIMQQRDKARKILQVAHDKGSVRSTAELIYILQEDIIYQKDPYKKMAIKQNIENLKRDISVL